MQYIMDNHLFILNFAQSYLIIAILLDHAINSRENIISINYYFLISFLYYHFQPDLIIFMINPILFDYLIDSIHDYLHHHYFYYYSLYFLIFNIL